MHRGVCAEPVADGQRGRGERRDPDDEIRASRTQENVACAGCAIRSRERNRETDSDGQWCVQRGGDLLVGFVRDDGVAAAVVLITRGAGAPVTPIWLIAVTWNWITCVAVCASAFADSSAAETTVVSVDGTARMT